MTGITFTPDTVGRLAGHPNIIGIKETSTDAGQIAAYVDASRGQDFAVLAGSAPAFYSALTLGAVGGILAVCCVVPRACVALFEAFTRGDHAAARELQRRIVPLAQAVTSGYGVPGLKVAMELAGYVGGPPRHPLMPAGADARAAIAAQVQALADFVSLR